MTIGIDGSRAFIEGRTGTENYSYQLIRNMSLIDSENRYLIYIKEDQKAEVKRQKFPDNFEFKVINLPRLWTQLGLALRTFVDPIDVLFVPSHTLPLIRRPGLKTVITVHDLGAEYLPAMHQLKQLLYLKLMTHYQIKTATKVISVSEATRKDLTTKVGIKQSKVEVVYEGVDKSVFKKISNDALNDIVKKYDLVAKATEPAKPVGERGKYFLFVGTIQPRKNLERLIVAFSKFLTQTDTAKGQVLGSKYYVSSQKKHNTKYIIPDTDFKLVLVGSKGWKSDEIYKLPAELRIEDKVRFLGRIADQDLVGLYNGALGLTYPSLFEGFGLPILEAFACSCPVVTSNVSSMPEVAGKAAILVNPESEKEILTAMRELFSNDILRSSLINKGILRLGRFDWKETAKRTIDILERTIKSSDDR